MKPCSRATTPKPPCAGLRAARGPDAFAAKLNGGIPGDAKAGLRVFKGRPRENLSQSYGPELADALGKAKPSEWQALKTSAGWRAMRLNSISAPKPASFEALGGVVLQDWKDALVKVVWLDGQSYVYTLTRSQPSVQLYGSADDRRGGGEIAKTVIRGRVPPTAATGAGYSLASDTIVTSE